MFTVFFFFSSASVMAMTSIAKSINIAIAILLKRSIGIAIAITFATSIAIAIAIVLSSIAYNPGAKYISGQKNVRLRRAFVLAWKMFSPQK